MCSQKERSTNTSDYMTASQAEAKDQAVNYTETLFVIAVSLLKDSHFLFRGNALLI